MQDKTQQKHNAAIISDRSGGFLQIEMRLQIALQLMETMHERVFYIVAIRHLTLQVLS